MRKMLLTYLRQYLENASDIFLIIYAHTLLKANLAMLVAMGNPLLHHQPVYNKHN